MQTKTFVLEHCVSGTWVELVRFDYQGWTDCGKQRLFHNVTNIQGNVKDYGSGSEYHYRFDDVDWQRVREIQMANVGINEVRFNGIA